MDEVTLVALRPEHEALVERWLHRPHVARWWGPAGVDLAALRDRPPEGGQALIVAAGRPVGYLRWQPADCEALAALGVTGIPRGAVDLDVFVGEPEWVGRGIGPRALRLLLERLCDAPMVGMSCSVENHAALRAYEKAGFRRLQRYADPEDGPSWVLAIRPGRKGRSHPDEASR